MATGDAAIAAGMDTVNGATTQASDIDEEINKSRDYIAEERSQRMAVDAGKVDKPADGGLMARREPGSVHSIGFYTNEASTLFFRPEPTTAEFDRRVAMHSEIPPAVDLSGYVQNGSSPAFVNLGVDGGIVNPGMVPVTSSYVAVYRNGDGRLGTSPSALKYKRDVHDYDGSALGLRPVTYVLIEDEKQTVRVGIIADEANDVEPLLVVHEDGEPESFKYELLAVALLRDVQRLAARVDELEQAQAAGDGS